MRVSILLLVVLGSACNSDAPAGPDAHLGLDVGGGLDAQEVKGPPDAEEPPFACRPDSPCCANGHVCIGYCIPRDGGLVCDCYGTVGGCEPEPGMTCCDPYRACMNNVRETELGRLPLRSPAPAPVLRRIGEPDSSEGTAGKTT